MSLVEASFSGNQSENLHVFTCFGLEKYNLKISELIVNSFSFLLGREEIGDCLVNYKNSQPWLPQHSTWLSANMLIYFVVLKTEPSMASPPPCATVKGSQEVQSGKSKVH